MPQSEKGSEGLAPFDALRAGCPFQSSWRASAGQEGDGHQDLYLRPGSWKKCGPSLPLAEVQYGKLSVIIWDQDKDKPDKTGIFDNTFILDNPDREMAGTHVVRTENFSVQTREVQRSVTLG